MKRNLLFILGGIGSLVIMGILIYDLIDLMRIAG